MTQLGNRRAAAAIIFDLDGTLIDSGMDIALAANHVRQRFARPALPLEVVLGHVGDGAPLLIERVLREGGGSASPDEVATGLEIFRRRYREHCLEHTTLYPGVIDTLEHFRAVPLAVATNKPRDIAQPILEGLDLTTRFRRVVTPEDAGSRKPDPAFLQLCLVGLVVPPAQVVVVGDSPNDVLGARAIGALAVGVTYGLSSREMISASGPDLLIDRCDRLIDLLAPAPPSHWTA